MPFRSGIKFTPTALEFTIKFFWKKVKMVMVDYESKSLIYIMSVRLRMAISLDIDNCRSIDILQVNLHLHLV